MLMTILKKIATSSMLVTGLLIGTTAWAQDDIFSGSAATDNEVAAEHAGEEKSGGGLKLERPLLLTRHTMQLGGQIDLNPQIRILKGDVPDKTAGGGVFTFSPQLGYFVIDKLELLFDFGLNVPFGTSNGGDDVTIGFDLGARYFLDFDVVALYFGGMLGFSWAVPDNPNLRVRDYFDLNVMVGVLVPLNRHIGIDLGMRMVTHVLMDGDAIQDGQERTRIYFPIGYLGVNGFFNIISGG